MNEPILSETNLLNIMKQVRQDIYAEAEQYAASIGTHPLTFARARELVLNPTRWTQQERDHVASCSYCTHIVASFERNMSHPTRWDILLWELGKADEAEQQRMRYHIEEGMCQHCQHQRQRLQAIRSTLTQALSVARLHDPQKARGASPDIRMEARSLDDRVDGTLRETNDSLRLIVRTRDETLAHQLVRYELQGEIGKEALVGYVVLSPDKNGWYAGLVTLPLNEVYGALGGGVTGVLLDPVGDEPWTREEQESLLTSVERDQAHETARQAWQAWTEAIERHQVSPALAQAVRDRLQG